MSITAILDCGGPLLLLVIVGMVCAAFYYHRREISSGSERTLEERLQESKRLDEVNERLHKLYETSTSPEPLRREAEAAKEARRHASSAALVANLGLPLLPQHHRYLKPKYQNLLPERLRVRPMARALALGYSLPSVGVPTVAQVQAEHERERQKRLAEKESQRLRAQAKADSGPS